MSAANIVSNSTAPKNIAERASIPEFAPVASVIVSEDFVTGGYDSAPLLKAVIMAGARITVLTSQTPVRPFFQRKLAALGLNAKEIAATEFVQVPHSHIWLRDFGPFPVLEHLPAKAPVLKFIDFKYGSGADDEIMPLQLGRLLKISVSALPVLIDGGNLLSAGDVCLTSSSTNAATTTQAELELNAGPYILKRQFAAAAGCKTVLVIENPPHPHVDMWIKVVAPGTLLVNELLDSTLAAYKKTYGAVPIDWLDLKVRLDQKAVELARHFRVKRLPMPLPYRGAFRTYTNAILVNGVAIVPRYRRYGWNYDDYPDAQFAARYERKVAATYQQLGYHTRFVNADGLIFNGGAFHCVAVQIPKVNAPR